MCLFDVKQPNFFINTLLDGNLHAAERLRANRRRSSLRTKKVFWLFEKKIKALRNGWIIVKLNWNVFCVLLMWENLFRASRGPLFTGFSAILQRALFNIIKSNNWISVGISQASGSRVGAGRGSCGLVASAIGGEPQNINLYNKITSCVSSTNVAS